MHHDQLHITTINRQQEHRVAEELTGKDVIRAHARAEILLVVWDAINTNLFGTAVTAIVLPYMAFSVKFLGETSGELKLWRITCFIFAAALSVWQCHQASLRFFKARALRVVSRGGSEKL